MKPKQILIPDLYTLHISIDGIAPLIWRRLVVDSRTTLFELHIYIQIVLGWKSYHLYRFNKGGVEFGDPRLWEEDPIIDDRKVSLEMVRMQPLRRMLAGFMASGNSGRLSPIRNTPSTKVTGNGPAGNTIRVHLI